MRIIGILCAIVMLFSWRTESKMPYVALAERRVCALVGESEWRAALLVKPDGTFSGYYVDVERGVEEIDRQERKVCDTYFRGKFSGEMQDEEGGYIFYVETIDYRNEEMARMMSRLMKTQNDGYGLTEDDVCVIGYERRVSRETFEDVFGM